MALCHCDRQGALGPGQRLELSRDCSASGARVEGASDALSWLFPEGMSRHWFLHVDVFYSGSVAAVGGVESLEVAIAQYVSISD